MKKNSPSFPLKKHKFWLLDCILQSSKLKDKILNIEKEQRNVVKHIETNYKDAISKVKDLVDFHSETLKE